MQTHTDEQLMLAVISGDQGALAALVERHHGQLVGYLYRLAGGDRALAQDLAQETFMRVMRAVAQHTYRPGSAFKPWLYAIATNLARDYFKSADIRHAAPALSGATERDAPEIADAAAGPEELALSREGARQVARSVGQLVPEYRAAVLLRFYGDMSLQEIADTLQVPLGTVKSRLSVGCRRLRELLSASAEDGPAEDRGAGGGQGSARHEAVEGHTR